MRRVLVVSVLLLVGVFAIWGVGTLVDRSTPEERASRELFRAVGEGALEPLYASLTAGADLEARDEAGHTPLILAAQRADIGAVRALLGAGADVNAQDGSGATALLHAVQTEDPQVALTLLQAAADPTVRNAEGRSALDYAADNGAMRRSQVLPLLEGAPETFDPDWPSGFVSPVPGATFSSREPHLPGSRRAYRNGYHEGFDFYHGVVGVDIAYGTPVVATADGVVVRAMHDYVEMTPETFEAILEDAANRPATPMETLDRLRGRQVWIEHPGGFVSRYAHLSGIPESVRIGERVVQGQVVGYAGNSGTSAGVEGTTEEPHPHYELWHKDTYLGEGLNPDQIYTLVAQVFGERALPPVRE